MIIFAWVGIIAAEKIGREHEQPADPAHDEHEADELRRRDAAAGTRAMLASRADERRDAQVQRLRVADSCSSIHGPATTMTAPVTRIFGMNESVASWIEVAAWKIETSRPTTSPAIRNGPPTLEGDRHRLDRELGDGVLVHAVRVERRDERLDDEVPTVDQDEQQDLERQRDQDRGQHHHPHRHQGRRDDHVDDQERQVDQEPDLERRLELAR